MFGTDPKITDHGTSKTEHKENYRSYSSCKDRRYNAVQCRAEEDHFRGDPKFGDKRGHYLHYRVTLKLTFGRPDVRGQRGSRG